MPDSKMASRLNSLYLLDALTNNLELVASTQENGPSSRIASSVCWIDNGILLFGGRTNPSTPLGDLWYFDLDSRTWYDLTSKADKSLSAWPSPRWSTSFQSMGDRVAVLFGGRDSSSEFGDCWSLHFAKETRTATWFCLYDNTNSIYNAEPSPGPLFRACLLPLCPPTSLPHSTHDSFLVLGGTSSLPPTSSLFHFKLSKRQWSTVPSVRFALQNCRVLCASPCFLERKTRSQSIPSPRNGASSPPTSMEINRSRPTQRAQRRLRPAGPNHRHHVLLPAHSVRSRGIHNPRRSRASCAHWRRRRVLLDAPFQRVLLLQSAGLLSIPAQCVYSSKGSFTPAPGVTDEERNSAGGESVDAPRDGFETGLRCERFSIEGQTGQNVLGGEAALRQDAKNHALRRSVLRRARQKYPRFPATDRKRPRIDPAHFVLRSRDYFFREAVEFSAGPNSGSDRIVL